jgi:hypothetical protein
MQRVTAFLALLVAGAALVACGGTLADDAGIDATGDGDSASDVSWECGDPDAAPVVVTCDDATKQACAVWAQSLVQNGTAHTVCLTDDGPISHYGHACVAAVDCYLVVQGEWNCSCGGFGCLPGQVCVTDSNDPKGHCSAACSE